MAPAKYQSLNLQHIHGSPDGDTVELRSVHEVQNAHEYTLLASLLEGRLKFLKQFKEPIPFKGIYQVKTSQDAIDLYFDYSQKAGIRWSEAKSMMIDSYKTASPSDAVFTCKAIFE